MYLRNYWYAATLSNEISDKPFARTICDEPIVFFRTSTGAVAALEDRCAHRHAPLSLGKVKGDTLECGYHGWAFGCSGKCTTIPGQANVPPRARVKSYPVADRWGWVWIWMGDAEAADEAKIPDLHWFGTPGWVHWHKYIHGKANYQLFMDNLLDISHTIYLHPNTIGSPQLPDTPLKVKIDGTTVSVERPNRNITPAPHIRRWGGFKGNIDALTEYSWEPPALIRLRTTRRDSENVLSYWLINPVTPETERTSHFWFAWASQKIDDPTFPQQTYKGIAEGVLLEDFPMIEAQQRTMDAIPGVPAVASNADAPIVAVHKVLESLFADERAAGRKAVS
jgi:vanillate monooxygenase